MRRKIIKVVMGVAIIPMILSGCNNEKADEKTVIRVGGWPSADTAFEAILPGFYELYPDIEVEIEMMDTGDHHQQLSTAIAAGAGAPDVAMLEEAWVGRYKDSGGFENLLEEPYNAGEMIGDFSEYKNALATSVDGEKLIGITWDLGPASLFYRRDVFEDAGLPSEPDEVEELLSTWDGFLEAAEAIYIPNERWIVPNAFYPYYWVFMNRDFYDENLELQLDRPGAREALEVSITLRENGWDAQFVDMWTNENHAAEASGSVATAVAGSWYGGFIKDWIAPDTEGLWGVTRLPGGLPDSNWGGSFLGIPSQSKHKEEAWAFIEYALGTAEAQNKMFETVDYFPGYIPAWDDPLYDEGDPFFGGQQTKKLWVDISKNLEPKFSTVLDSTTEGAMTNAINTGLNKGLDADGIIELIYEQIEMETREEREAAIDILKDAGKWNK